MRILALMISDSGRVLKEIPMLHNIKKDDTPKEFAYIGFHKAIYKKDTEKFVEKIKEAHYYIDKALKEATNSKVKFVLEEKKYRNKAWDYALAFEFYLNDILKEFKELEILKALHPLLSCDSESFLNKYWR
jgi:hypothetical protein